MKKIEKLPIQFDVRRLLWTLQANPQLWNENNMRTAMPGSPHEEVDDIWVRYAADPLELGPHESVWWPSAKILGDAVREIVYPLMQFVRAERMGGILITRIRAGKKCKPHVDEQWHSRYYMKYAVQVQSAPGQAFCFEGERLSALPGEVYQFRNEHVHWVENDTPYDRITMICCLRQDQGEM